ncbi:polysaccharide deacetylase family protein, partial [Caminibacter pacificus]
MSSQKTKRLDIVLYEKDSLDLFHSNNTPDAIITNWAITSTPKIDDKEIPVNDAGVIWHGLYGKGKWFYFSFPLYVFLDMPINDFKFLFNNIINYFQNNITVVPYPYIDHKSVIFISEDTEYKYENMINFTKLAKEKDINVTLFCVADLAMKYPKITREAATFPNVEIGSHSLTHTKIMGTNEEKVKKEILSSKEILEKISGQKVYGFRPPREEIDKLMEIWLRKAGYIYVMEKTKS